ncbi:hypothetical protein ZPR_1888 [Zunongwangia profunda SM-A87]|uniref:Uncharacterized protein n=1 Tax=Zunongwangia profunda (strain DSM 18752 / CCTCC AB 206139 / SM-A87) TaxID=655815 RepID=D5B9C8_ZUNPS|nr:hypothetical protein ZPR_1888 [Zunongwangia profunda SM-A87]
MYFCTPFWQKNGNPKGFENQNVKHLLSFILLKYFRKT